MPLPVIADHFRTISEFTSQASGKPWTVCMDYDGSGVTVDLTDEDVAFAMLGGWQAFFAQVIGAVSVEDQFFTGTSLDQVTVYDLTADKAPYVLTTTPSVQGDGISALPADVAICISKRTATRGRRGRGRIYLGGLATASLTPATGFIAFADILSLGANNHLLNLIVGPIGSEEDLPMCVISQAVTPAGISYPVDTLTVDNSFDTQRRRGVA